MRFTSSTAEAEDLVQDALLIAVEHDRFDLTQPSNQSWLRGVIRKQGAMKVRSAIRRRRREDYFAQILATPDCQIQHSTLHEFVTGLPRSLRQTVLLLVSLHSKDEISWLLGLSDTAFRKRISDIRRLWRLNSADKLQPAVGLTGDLAYGIIRQSLLARMRQPGNTQRTLGTHDPDGHLIQISSQIKLMRQPIKS